MFVCMCIWCASLCETEMEVDGERHGRNQTFSKFISKYKFYSHNSFLEKRSRREITAGLKPLSLSLSFFLLYVMDNIKLITYDPIMYQKIRINKLTRSVASWQWPWGHGCFLHLCLIFMEPTEVQLFQSALPQVHSLDLGNTFCGAAVEDIKTH